ncbi:MAG: prolyl oligopeptidase family serine peptidase [Pseudosphingobacterium sp.]|nr:prolyl oligopeptidase family serine peptidase [Pseudosphingobacterium sp.]
MKFVIGLAVCFLALKCQVFAQSKELDTSIIGNWPYVDSPVITNDGKYVSYVKKYVPKGKQTLVIKSIKNYWTKEFLNASYCQFTDNSKYCMLSKALDTTVLINLETKIETEIVNTTSRDLFTSDGRPYLAYLTQEQIPQLIIYDIQTSKELSVDSVKEFKLSPDHKMFLLKRHKKIIDSVGESLELFEWKINKRTHLGVSGKINNLTFSSDSKQIAYQAELNSDNKTPAICYYHLKERKTAILLTENDLKSKGDLTIGNQGLRFSKDNKYLYFNATDKLIKMEPPKSNAAMVDVWSYFDENLQSAQLNDLENRDYLSVFNIESHNWHVLETDDERVYSIIPIEEQEGDYILLKKATGDEREYNWRLESRPSIILVSLKDGSRKVVNKSIFTRTPYYVLSPKGNFLVYYDYQENSYCSLNTQTWKTINLTTGLKSHWQVQEYDRPGSTPVYGLAAWDEDDKHVYIYDHYDIWRFNLLENREPSCVTNRYGAKNRIEFRLFSHSISPSFKSNDWLCAFNPDTKQNGFFHIEKEGKDPSLSAMNNYLYNRPSVNGWSLPIKARDSETYIVRRMAANESPNYYITNDFKSFESVSEVFPEREYNWVTSSLVQWKTSEGSISKGILYKPQDFDPTKKYPIIFFVYEQFSDQLNLYVPPGTGEGSLNISWYVNKNYLVFAPDIHYKIGNPGLSAYNAVISAAEYLFQYPYIDSTKMGIAGHSLGGYETNYIVANSNLFAAAASSSGVSNLTSDYGSLVLNGRSGIFQSEVGAYRMNAPLSFDFDNYVKNSPIYHLRNMLTPMLIMHNKEDNTVNWSQSIELFLGLRRLNKKAWMLQYDGDSHQLNSHCNALDYLIRQNQFFDHFLKDLPMPLWMKSGIPARKKGIEDGLGRD